MVRKICDACMGNGYRRIWKDQTEREKNNNTMCKNAVQQGR